MSLKKRYVKNSFFNVAGWGWSIFLNILIIPYMIHKMGYDQYGILALVLLVLGYFAFLDFGLGDAVVKYISHYNTLSNIGKISRILNSILFLFIMLGIIGGIFIILFTKFFALRIFKIPNDLHPIATYCFYLSSLGFLLNLILAVISRIPEALQRFDLSNRNNIIVSTVVAFLNILVLYWGYGLKEVVLVNILGTLLGILLFSITAKKLLPQIVFNLTFTFKDFREVLNFGVFTVFTRFSSLITMSINQLFISSLIGTTGVTLFHVPFKIISRLQGFIDRLSFVAFPMSSELSAQNNQEKLQNIYLKLSKYVFILSSALFIPIIAYSKYILFYWLGADFANRGTYLMIMISLTFYLSSLTMVPSLFVLGLGKPKYNAFFSSLTALINIILIYPLTKIWGINGSATALFLSTLHFPLAIYMINKKVISINNGTYFDFVFRKLILCNVFVFLIYNQVLNNLIINLPTFLFLISGSYGLLITFYYKLGLEGKDKKWLHDEIVNIRAKLLYE